MAWAFTVLGEWECKKHPQEGKSKGESGKAAKIRSTAATILGCGHI